MLGILSGGTRGRVHEALRDCQLLPVRSPRGLPLPGVVRQGHSRLAKCKRVREHRAFVRHKAVSLQRPVPVQRGHSLAAVGEDAPSRRNLGKVGSGMASAPWLLHGSLDLGRERSNLGARLSDCLLGCRQRGRRLSHLGSMASQRVHLHALFRVLPASPLVLAVLAVRRRLARLVAPPSPSGGCLRTPSLLAVPVLALRAALRRSLQLGRRRGREHGQAAGRVPGPRAAALLPRHGVREGWQRRLGGHFA
mmetsp:Transcript_21208/g.80982  ORF Transcript_21208/g.80982 Transcript_21208/m.80982 type:complete len:250 (+) Transcript_21208:1028-1777(+)